MFIGVTLTKPLSPTAELDKTKVLSRLVSLYLLL